jgi:hypothetical protein
MQKRYLVIGCLLAVAAIHQGIEYPGLQQSSQVKEARGWNARQPKVWTPDGEFVLTAGQRTRCRQLIQRAMHNPNSFRWEGSMSDMRRTGVLVYSGTNAFGGRVRETYKCA